MKINWIYLSIVALASYLAYSIDTRMWILETLCKPSQLYTVCVFYSGIIIAASYFYFAYQSGVKLSKTLNKLFGNDFAVYLCYVFLSCGSCYLLHSIGVYHPWVKVVLIVSYASIVFWHFKLIFSAKEARDNLMKMQEAYKGTELRRSRAEELLDWAENNVPKSYIWENAVSKNDAVPIVKFSELASLKSFIWTEFKKGCDLRKLPNAIDGFMVLECKMKRGTIIEKHAQDFYEAFLIMSGKVRDNVTGEILTANGKPRAWKRGEPHEPECIEDAYLIVFCKL